MAKKSPKKTIHVSCQAAATVPLNELLAFQGDLKVMAEDDFQRFRLSIIEHGLTFAKHVWRDKGKKHIIDGHQTVLALKRMRDDDGYSIPDIPVVWVDAKTPAEAARKVLAAISQYGKVQTQGLYDFMDKFSIDISYLQSQFVMPEVDLARFQQSYFPDSASVSFQAKPGSTELSQGEFSKFQHRCPKCKFEFNE